MIGRLAVSLALCAAAAPAGACGRAICAIPPESLNLTRVVGFEGVPSAFGPGRPVEGVLELDGASFGEHFEGQTAREEDGFDRIAGSPAGPLTLRPGAEGRNLSVMRLAGGNVLSGDGPAGFPHPEATGEGAIAILFAHDQAALRLWLRGGEGGAAEIVFLDRAGVEIDRHRVARLGEHPVAFRRAPPYQDIAGLVLTNDDPEGIALQKVEFEGAATLG